MGNQSIWLQPLELSEVNRRAKNTLSHFLGIEFVEVGDDFLTARMPIAPKVSQPMGVLHGGASAALAETVASAAANYCVDQTIKVCVGLELNINHLRPLKSGYADAVAKPLHLGKTTQVWEIKIYDSEKKLISAGRLTVAVLSKG
ncbi:MAG TPA: PaaI family thioesterase [Chlamydiales bacterium]|jgi:1,4-dihydroxy-2-naphthoyl-CoA hydrolase|nr:PaaI family thioesterase [Chlamydiales bacterium]